MLGLVTWAFIGLRAPYPAGSTPCPPPYQFFFSFAFFSFVLIKNQDTPRIRVLRPYRVCRRIGAILHVDMALLAVSVLQSKREYRKNISAFIGSEK